MEAAADLDPADFALRSNHSGAASRSGSGYSRATGTGVDVESGEAASLVGGRGHRSMYAALAEEALLGAVSPYELEGSYDRSLGSSQPELLASEFQDAAGATWRMGSAGSLWRLETGGGASESVFSARCCLPVTDEARQRSFLRLSWALTGCLGLALLLGVLAAVATVQRWLDQPEDDTAPLATHVPSGVKAVCCAAATAACFACRAGVAVEEFCRSKGSARGVVGCEAEAVPSTSEGGSCCHGELAECLACRAGLALPEYCALPARSNVTGCGPETCGLVERGVEYVGGDLYSVGEVESTGACCDLCRREPRCSAWAWAGPSAPVALLRRRCLLKRPAELLLRRQQGFTSGLAGPDTAAYQLKLRHGLCLTHTTSDDLALEACHTSDRVSQRLLFVRGLGRLALADGRCLEGSSHRDGPVSLRPCDSSLETQHWAFESSSGQLRLLAERVDAVAGDDPLCLHAPHRTREGGAVVMHVCAEGFEEQQWSFWSSALLGRDTTVEAMAREALQTTATRTTSTTLEVTTTTTTHLPTLFCFSVMVSWNYEPGLVRMQAAGRRSIFGCDGYAVYSDAELDLGRGIRSRIVQGTDLKCDYGGEFHTLLNTPVFQKVWEQVINDGLYLPFDWVAKVDCDAVFFPQRLRALVRGEAFEGAQDGPGSFMNNCGFGLHGPLEVVTRQSLLTYKEAWTHCDTPPQEDVYLQACMNKLGVVQINAFQLLAEEACKTPDWKLCRSSHVAFHPFKSEADYQGCEARALE